MEHKFNFYKESILEEKKIIKNKLTNDFQSNNLKKLNKK